MKSIWFIIYNVVAFPLLLLTSRFVALFKTKIRTGLAGKSASLKLVEQARLKRNPGTKLILFHCASLGEYEQIKPILKALAGQNIVKVVSFFSPSGYENMGENPDVDLKIYLPVDSLMTTRKFLNHLQPDLVVISKHDIWPNLIWSLQSRRIPVILVNGTMPLDSFMTKPLVRHFYRTIFSGLNFIAPANQADYRGFYKIVKDNVTMEILGDTRFDQVLVRSLETRGKNLLPQSFFVDKLTIVAGSTWPSDEEHLFPAFLKLLHQFPELFLIIVPHEPTAEHIEPIRTFFRKKQFSTVNFSEGDLRKKLPESRILIVDRIGILANLYGYGQIAYVGGSFVPGVHNVMEPAAFHLPVLFGPKILNSPEALELVRREAGFKVENSEDVLNILEKLCADSEYRKAAGERGFNLVNENRGAAGKIVNYIDQFLGDENIKNV